MQHHDPARLASFGAFSHDFATASPYPAIAERDLRRLAALSKQVVDDLEGWADRLAAIDCATPLNRTRALLLILETVLDEVLSPDGCRVLEAEIALLRS